MMYPAHLNILPVECLLALEKQDNNDNYLSRMIFSYSLPSSFHIYASYLPFF